MSQPNPAGARGRQFIGQPDDGARFGVPEGFAIAAGWSPGVTSTSKSGFADAIENGIRRASKTIHGITGAWVADQEVVVKSGKIVEYKARMKLTFVLDDKK